ncbi:hypothetical protein F511_20782 [Dorcoceras hygrometricum]|uniref:Uncharacterized protein n=1 Tax=Dorcoceras hygrometricum TaxID=472368 RepID=A0A2Z7C5R0_9LAMI|nr:hypothetical protein F511_20782 [Dorcoceras hygrometricum]
MTIKDIEDRRSVKPEANVIGLHCHIAFHLGLDPDCGRYRQSGPRPDTRLLRHSALEGVTRSARTDSPRQIGRNRFRRRGGDDGGDGGGSLREEGRRLTLGLGKSHSPKSSSRAQHIEPNPCGNLESSTCVTLNGSGIQLAVGPQPLWLRNHNSGLAHRIMVQRLATSPHDPLGIIDSACKNQLVVVSVQYDPFNPYIPIRSTIIGKSRVAIDPIAMHTSWR